MSVTANPDRAEVPALVVFGRDEAGKPHASWFDQSEAKLARKAARLMDLRLLAPRTKAERALAAKVARGRVFASGRAFVPFVKASLFLELQAAAPANKAMLVSSASPAKGGKPASPKLKLVASAELPGLNVTGLVRQPIGWADIAVGAVVLAMDPPDYPDWYEATVLAIKEAEHFTLRWRYWPDDPPFTRRRVEIGLMHPACPAPGA